MPESIVIADSGESEADCAVKHIQAGKIYIYDRVGYFTSPNACRAGLKDVKLREVILEF